MVTVKGIFKKARKPPTVPLPTPPPLSSLPVSSQQCELAVNALLAHAEKTKKGKEGKELIERDEDVFLIITLKKMDAREKHKPVRIPLPHSLIDPRESPVCLLTKDPQREYKDLLSTNDVKFISRVVGYSKLTGKFKPFEARRELMRENELFLADERILPALGKLWGKMGRDAKKQPIPVKINGTNLKQTLERAICSTYLHLSLGTCLSLKIGSLSSSSPSSTPSTILANLLAVLPYLAVRIPCGGWENVQALNIKTTTSISLPVWTCGLGGEGKGGRFVGSGEEGQVEGGEKKKGKGKKRVKMSEFVFGDGSEGQEGEVEGEGEGEEGATPVPVPAPTTKKDTKSKKRKSEPESAPTEAETTATTSSPPSKPSPSSKKQQKKEAVESAAIKEKNARATPSEAVGRKKPSVVKALRDEGRVIKKKKAKV